jgi:PKD repeat protein
MLTKLRKFFLVCVLVWFCLASFLGCYRVPVVFADLGSFGYAAIGGSGQNVENSICGSNGSSFVPSFDGTAQNIFVALKRVGGTALDKWNGKCAIYFASNFSLLGQTDEVTEIGLTTSYSWRTFTFSTTVNVKANTEYVLCVWLDTDSTGTANVACDAGNSNQGHIQSSTYTTSFPSSLTDTTNNTNKFSIYCQYIYTVSVPQHNALSVTGYFADTQGVFRSNWSTATGTLSHYIFSTNNTGSWVNDTQAFPYSSKSYYLNYTLTLNSTGDLWIGWRVYVNNSFNQWNNTDIQAMYVWKAPLAVTESNFGFSSGYGLYGIYYNATSTGGKEFIAVAYQNSSFSPWHFEIRAYDLVGRVWTAPYNVANMKLSESDGHWAPTVSLLPIGTELRLIYMQAYGSPLRYAISLNDVKTTSNLTKLMSEWTSVYSYCVNSTFLKTTDPAFDYPDSLFLDDRLIVFLREGGASIGNTVMVEYNSTREWNAATYVEGMDNSIREWSTVGGSPYLNDSFANYIYMNRLDVSYRKEGWFNLTGTDYRNELFYASINNCTPFNTTCKVLLELYVNNSMASDNTQVYVNDWNTKVGTLPTLTNSWYSINVTSWINDTGAVCDAKIGFNSTGYFGGTGNYHPMISKARLNVTWIGFSPPKTIVQHVGSDSQYMATAKNASRVMLAWVFWNATAQTENNVYFLYSPDKGDTWKYVNGTSASLAVYGNSSDAKIADAASRVRPAQPLIDENEKVVVPFTRCDAGMYGRHYDWYLRIAQYSASLGQTGTWMVTDAVDQNESRIYGTSTEATFCVHGYYDRPSFWTSGNQSAFHATKYVRFPNNSTKFLATETAFSGHKTQMMINYPIRDSLMRYEQVGLEAWLDICGTFPSATINGNYTEPYDVGYFWGTKFTATTSANVTALEICGNTSYPMLNWRVALYNSSGCLLSNSTQNYQLVSGTNGNGWLLGASFTSQPEILAGQEYYLSFGVNTTGTQFSFRRDNATSINQSFSCAWESFGSFPQTLSEASKINYNYSISINARTTFVIIKGLNRPPTANFTESATTVLTNENIDFDASGSYDPDGTIIDFSWDFGDGTKATGINVSHAYADDGVYTVALTVMDDEGATDSTTSKKTVLNRPPVASFTESAEIAYTFDVIQFNASASYDPDGIIVSYLWDFGDGTNSTAIDVGHAYADDGVYTVALTVTDDDDATGTSSENITVLNRPPIANFNESAETVLTGEPITFDASSSFDLDGWIISYFWDFGDGTNLTDIVVDHSYVDDGIYTVTLAVTDDDEATTTNTSTITVLNRPPVALFTESATIVFKGEAIEFNASESYDLDGTIVSYLWTFGDGKNATGVTVSHAYAVKGTYVVTLTVTDDDGAGASANATKTVIGGHDIEVTNVTVSKNVAGQGYTLTINVTLSNLGDTTETFNVTIYGNTTQIIMFSDITLVSDGSTSFTFTWNTSDFAFGNYTISAYAWPVENETDTTNNLFTDGYVKVGIPGDINGDRVVDSTDLGWLGWAWGAYRAGPNYIPESDINDDGVVDSADLGIMGGHWGEAE